MDNTFLVTLVLIGVVLLFGILLLTKQKKRIDLFDKKLESVWKKIEVIQHDVSALCASGLGVDQRVGGAEQRVRSMIERLEELEENDSYEHLQEFKTAIKLAQEGATSDEIVETCHLTADEARLLLKLHQA
ncbi:MAG: hypothetical protein COB26_09220 [Piscirickettsiaceae bacterium]|nr:MAG: hypothetical protein COB89_02075 [Piscirickettsiaceae bacterium]PCI67767.1 MAG: hypothetical protein COB26_09220 [Piscirickettsiaceae bacterium]